MFAANGSNEVLQTLCLTYGGAGRSVAVFEPTYALHAHIARITGTEVVVGERTDDFALDLDEVAGCSPAGPAITFLCSPNNPTGLVEPREVVEAVLDAGARASSWSTRPTGSSRRGRALELVDEATPLVVTRTFSKTWSMAAARLGYLVGPAWLVDELEKVVLPYHLDAVKQAGRPARAALHRRDGGAGRRAGRGAGPAVGRARRPRRRRVAVGRQLRAVPAPVDATAPRCGRQLVDRSVLVRNCASWPRLDGCLRVTVGTRAEDDAFLARPRGGPRMTPRQRPRERTTKETDDRRRARPRRPDRARSRPPPGCRSSTTCSTSSAATAASTSPSRPRATSTSTATTPSRTSASCSARPSPRRWATRPACAASPAGSFPLDEALVEVALDLSGRPFVVYDVPFGEVLPLGDPPFNPEMAEHFWQSFATAAGITLHVHQEGRPQHPPRRRGHVQGRGPLPARRGAGRGRRRPVHEGDVAAGDRSSRSSTTASATCARPRRRSQHVGADARLTADHGLIADAAGVVLPGVGAFGRCMESLRDDRASPTSRVEAAHDDRPFLGICVGMQMLYEVVRRVAGRRRPRRPARADRPAARRA